MYIYQDAFGTVVLKTSDQLLLSSRLTHQRNFNMSEMFDKKPHAGDSSPTISSEENHLGVRASVNDGTVSPPIVDPELEKQALRRFDMFLLPQLALLTILAYLDRTNIGENIQSYPFSVPANKNRKCQGLWICSRPQAQGKGVQQLGNFLLCKPIVYLIQR